MWRKIERYSGRTQGSKVISKRGDTGSLRFCFKEGDCVAIGNWLKKNASTFLTCIGAGGMIATVVLAVKATPNAQKKIAGARIEKRQALQTLDDPTSVFNSPTNLTPMETVLVCWKEYAPAMAVGTASLICIFGANLLSRRQQASLISAYAALDQAFGEYRNKVISLAGAETDNAVMNSIQEEHKDSDEKNPPWEVVQTFYLEGYPKFFDMTMEKVARAEYCLNRIFVLRGYATFNEFLHFLGLDDLGEKGEHIGWESYIGEAFYGYQWIGFDHIHRVSNDGFRVCDIQMPFPPHSLDDSLYEGESAPSCGVE